MDKQERERLRALARAALPTQVDLLTPQGLAYWKALQPAELLHLLDALDAAEQRAEAVERDAARYRWALPILTGGPEHDTRLLAVGMALFRGLDGNAAIDAAMGGQTREGGES